MAAKLLYVLYSLPASSSVAFSSQKAARLEVPAFSGVKCLSLGE